MESIREKMKSFIGENHKLSERELTVIEDLYDMVRLDEMKLAKDMETAVNSFGVNTKLFGEALASLDGEYACAFIKYLIYQFCSKLASNYRRGFYDLRNEGACKNACEIQKNWSLGVDLPSALYEKADKTANYWCMYTHRTLQQTMMRVFIYCLQKMAESDTALQSVMNLPILAMPLI